MSQPQAQNPPIQGQNYEANNQAQMPPNYPPYPNMMENNMNIPPYPPQQNQMSNPPPMGPGGDNFTYEFNQPNQNEQEYSSAYLRSGQNKEEKKKDIKNNLDKLKGGFKFNFGQGGLGGMLNMVNNVAQNFFGFGGSSTNDNNNNMGGFSNMGFMGAGSNMFSPFGYSQNNYYMPSNGNYYYCDDGSEQREYGIQKN